VAGFMFKNNKQNFMRQPTKEALALKDALERHGLRVLVEVGADGHKHVDLAIPAARLNIEVDGNQHLTNPRQILSDLKREHGSDQMGYDTIHIPNTQIHTELEAIASALADAAIIREQQLKRKFGA
jgi:very-short-patch-repair endonuclease